MQTGEVIVMMNAAVSVGHSNAGGLNRLGSPNAYTGVVQGRCELSAAERPVQKMRMQNTGTISA